MAALSVGVAVVLWRTVRKNPRLMGPGWKRPDTAAGWARQVYLGLAAAIGLVGGIWLAMKANR